MVQSGWRSWSRPGLPVVPAAVRPTEPLALAGELLPPGLSTVLADEAGGAVQAAVPEIGCGKLAPRLPRVRLSVEVHDVMPAVEACLAVTPPAALRDLTAGARLDRRAASLARTGAAPGIPGAGLGIVSRIGLRGAGRLMPLAAPSTLAGSLPEVHRWPADALPAGLGQPALPGFERRARRSRAAAPAVTTRSGLRALPSGQLVWRPVVGLGGLTEEAKAVLAETPAEFQPAAAVRRRIAPLAVEPRTEVSVPQPEPRVGHSVQRVFVPRVTMAPLRPGYAFGPLPAPVAAGPSTRMLAVG
jgi:hypothetical protein